MIYQNFIHHVSQILFCTVREALSWVLIIVDPMLHLHFGVEACLKTCSISLGSRSINLFVPCFRNNLFQYFSITANQPVNFNNIWYNREINRFKSKWVIERMLQKHETKNTYLVRPVSSSYTLRITLCCFSHISSRSKETIETRNYF